MGIPGLFSSIWAWLGLALLALSVLTLACSDDAAPGECIDAARDAGVPKAVTDWMKQPSDELSSIERIAIREALEKFGLGDVCSEVADRLDLVNDLIPDTSLPSLAKETPIPGDTPTPIASIDTTNRADRQLSEYIIHERDDDYPEVIGLEHKGVPGDSNSRFVILMDELVQVKERKSVYLRVRGPDGYEDSLELRTLTTSSRPSRTLEFGPVEEPLSRLYSLEGSSYVIDGDDHSLQFDSDELRRHPNALFLSSDYALDIQDRSLVRCAAVMEFNDISPILVKSLRTVDAASLGDTERFEWFTTLIDELSNASFSSDRVELDFDQDDFLTVMKHPCAVLWSEVVTSQNADKRNARGECRPHDLDVSDLLKASYLSLNATDRLVLRRELGGWSAVDCLIYYPQLYTGLWIPLPLDS